eukprot:TRINITY_DN6401_c0_g2_i2.p3 TRINITY_DN6401_c0_g2~~TRINITY_DN6401_c0_g2_i2.p3  ORF type:complete len:140 (+),score=42.87 TRINITY_DN6401_c0_g2_i2:935-1354(+)
MTPLGCLSSDQIDKGNQVLKELTKILSKSHLEGEDKKSISKLSSQFYSYIPHTLDSSLKNDVLDNPLLVQEKLELLQVMNDVLDLSETPFEQTSKQLEMQYRALNCNIEYLDPKSVNLQILNTSLRLQHPRAQLKTSMD